MTVAELIDRALTLDSDDYWEVVSELQARNDAETYAAAVELTRDANPDRRKLGVDILSQLGATRSDEDRPYRGPSVDLLLERIATEPHPHVIASILNAFGPLHDPRTIGPTVAFASHPDEHIRLAVVHGLFQHDDDRVVDTLLALMEDPDDDVRDWATFELGSINTRDTPQVREALAARLTDRYVDVRHEAIAGLALRADPRGLAPLIEDYEDGWEGPLIDEAGEAYVEAGLIAEWPPPE
ncbi:HEAT repeat domain-containing protein [Solirubrobacter phytolaccae]|uniref:HEAT repeat domain-containing protein n=1 Tax=Solirubrobacter phytolaccae TaxID=1404360 RepID=A0A9X3SH06_9ACTN|nr:HEAT repeat domain-containing protein [Solirubrobacter phytolaccae]MDA0182927.1 HEAT repeat domain-containing protein [Solirubrobacter phytolaccae]